MVYIYVNFIFGLRPTESCLRGDGPSAVDIISDGNVIDEADMVASPVKDTLCANKTEKEAYTKEEFNSEDVAIGASKPKKEPLSVEPVKIEKDPTKSLNVLNRLKSGMKKITKDNSGSR